MSSTNYDPTDYQLFVQTGAGIPYLIGMTGTGVPTTQVSGTGAILTVAMSTDLTAYAKLDGTNQPFTGNLQLSGSNIFPSTANTQTVGSSTNMFSGTYSNQYATTQISGITVGSSKTIDWNTGSSQIINFAGGVSGTCTLTLSNGIAGSSYSLQTINNTSGTTQTGWGGSNIIWQSATSGTMTQTASAIDLFVFYYNGTKYLGSFSSAYA